MTGGRTWLPHESLSVQGRDRVVTFEGFVNNQRIRAALHVAATSIAEEIRVNDKLI